jgi:uncharacterized membrane protein
MSLKEGHDASGMSLALGGSNAFTSSNVLGCIKPLIMTVLFLISEKIFLTLKKIIKNFSIFLKKKNL